MLYRDGALVQLCGAACQAAGTWRVATAVVFMAWPSTSASRRVQLPQPGFQPQAFLTCLVEQAPAATQLCTSDSVTALQIQTYTIGLMVRADSYKVSLY